MRHRYDWKLMRERAGDTRAKLSRFLYRHTETWKFLAQVALGVVTLIGISMYSVPVALIIGGLAGIISLERQ